MGESKIRSIQVLTAPNGWMLFSRNVGKPWNVGYLHDIADVATLDEILDYRAAANERIKELSGTLATKDALIAETAGALGGLLAAALAIRDSWDQDDAYIQFSAAVSCAETTLSHAREQMEKPADGEPSDG